MSRYWILCMNEDNYEIARKQRLVGMAERQRRTVQKITTGDMLTFYISKKTVDSPPNDPAHKVQRFRGAARVTGLLIDQGESPKYIQAQLGHASIQVTIDRYGHFLPDMNQQAARRLEESLFGPSVRKPLDHPAF